VTRRPSPGPKKGEGTIRIFRLALGRNDRCLADRVLADRILADRELSDWSGLLDRLRMRHVRRESCSDNQEEEELKQLCLF